MLIAEQTFGGYGLEGLKIRRQALGALAAAATARPRDCVTRPDHGSWCLERTAWTG